MAQAAWAELLERILDRKAVGKKEIDRDREERRQSDAMAAALQAVEVLLARSVVEEKGWHHGAGGDHLLDLVRGCPRTEDLATCLEAACFQADFVPLFRAGLLRLKPALQGTDPALSWIEKLGSIAAVEGGAHDDADVRLGYFLVAVASLLIFASANLSGPPPGGDLSEDPERCGSQGPRLTKEEAAELSKRLVLEHTSVDGEYVVGKPELVGYLCTASVIFKKVDLCQSSELELASAPWWKLRALHLHQKLLHKNSATLKAELVRTANEISQSLRSLDEGVWGRECLAAAEIECAGVMQTYQLAQEAVVFIKRAGDRLGMGMKATGVMGKRTVHQVDAKAQMVVVTEHAGGGAGAERDGRRRASTEDLPRDWLLEGLDQEDILLLPKLEGEEEHMADLTPCEQALVLVYLVQVSKSQAKTEIQSWEMMPYCQCVFKQDRPGAFAKMAATLHAARFERERNRTRERSLVRMEKLVEVLQLPQPGAVKRLPGIFTVDFPPLPLFHKEYGEMLIAMAMVGAALVVFEKYEHWDSLIVCYQLLQKTAQAQKLINDRLAESPDDPRLWCALGDVTKDDSCYVKAWERSGRRHARAQRSLAASAMRNDDYAAAVGHWELALALNPLNPSGWFALGYSYMREGDESSALRAFTRVTQLSPDNAEAWNNLAALHMKRQTWKMAFAALKEATRLRRESWQLWDNYVEAGLMCGHVMLSLYGLQRIAAMECCHKVSLSSLDLLLDVVSRVKREGGGGGATNKPRGANVNEDLSVLEINDSDEEEGEEEEEGGEGAALKTDLPDPASRDWQGVEEKVLDILKKFAATSAASHRLWRVMGRYYELVGSATSAKEMWLKENRALLQQDWKGDRDLFRAIVESSKKLVDATLECDKSGASSLRYHLKGILKQAAANFEGDEGHEELRGVLERLEKAVE